MTRSNLLQPRKPRRSRGKLSGLALIFTLGIVAYSQPSSAAEPIRIGVAAPFTGSQAKIGTDMLQGAELAVAEWNARGGIGGRSIEIVEGDDEASPKQAPIIARELIGKKVAGVVGHFNSGCVIPASEIYDEAGVVMITPAVAYGVIKLLQYSDGGRYFIDKTKLAKIEMYAGGKPTEKVVLEREGDGTKWKISSQYGAPVAQEKIDTTRSLATPSCSPFSQPGARISTVVFSPLVKTRGSDCRFTIPKSFFASSWRCMPYSFSHGLMLRLKNCHQLWTFTPFGVLPYL